MTSKKASSWQKENLPEVIINIAEKYNLVLPENKDDQGADFWPCFTKWITTHNAIMRIAHMERIVFEPPEKNFAGDTNDEFGTEVSLLIKAVQLGEPNEEGKSQVVNSCWTFGEANTRNCKVLPYMWAMAEKRGKDRATLQLTGLYRHISSEIEADEFSYKQDKDNDVMVEDDFKPFRGGNFKDFTISQMPTSQLEWIIEKSSMGDGVKNKARSLIEARDEEMLKKQKEESE